MENNNFYLPDNEHIGETKTLTARKRVMIAGVGNMFMQDDGFGGAVIKKILTRKYPEGVEIKDFGTGGLKLAYDLLKGYDALILIDAAKRGEPPGTVYVIEPDEKEISSDLEEGGLIDPHGADPVTVLRFVKGLGAWPAKVLLIGCEPDSVDDFQIGLSEPVSAAVDKAADLVDDILKNIYTSK
ncbi:MAG: hydrogenase maturation protease [bacterium]